MADFKSLLKDFKNKKFAKVIILHGTEPYFQDRLLDTILQLAIPSHEKDFNEYKLAGKDLTAGGLVSYARRFPMMAERQLVVVRGAEQLQDIGQKEAGQLLEDYFLKPLESTVLVLQFATKLDERKSWVKATKQHAEVFLSNPLYDSELPEFVRGYADEQGYQIELKAIVLLVEFVGNDLQRLVNELDKIVLNTKAGELITTDHVEKYVGISKEFNIFELQRAISFRQLPKAYQILTYFGANTKQNPIQPVVLNLFNYFTKVLLVNQLGSLSDAALAKEVGVKPFFLKEYRTAARNFSLSQIRQAIGAVRAADMQSKGVGNMPDEQAIYQQLLLGIFA